MADPNCKYCGGTGTYIHDTYDHRGEHVQTDLPCECTIPQDYDEDDNLSIEEQMDDDSDNEMN